MIDRVLVCHKELWKIVTKSLYWFTPPHHPGSILLSATSFHSSVHKIPPNFPFINKLSYFSHSTPLTIYPHTHRARSLVLLHSTSTFINYHQLIIHPLHVTKPPKIRLLILEHRFSLIIASLITSSFLILSTCITSTAILKMSSQIHLVPSIQPLHLPHPRLCTM